ncbi:MAG: ATP-binding protein, partial [Candidatus Eremiobacteraeota bacterium]|nr:ATP-binding protein [Candidatus Eremiobacteraeota bacterium]
MAIRELDALTIGQIAAGEIIERPASVVKELVENSIDARAARITVNVRDGGLALIEVIDDGIGMPPEDLPLALRRHATSKLRRAAELESIATLGFRGEGLASIAAVAATEVVSRTADAGIASSIMAHGERVGSGEPVAAPPGTSVRVRELFERLPVRREYLRSPSAEFNRISSWLASFALAYPEVAFALRHDGKDVWVMPATDSAQERLAMVFGRDAAQRLIPLG